MVIPLLVGPVMPLMALFSYTMLIMSLLNLWKTFRTAPSAEERNRSAYIIVGLDFALLGDACDIVPILGLPLYPGAIIGNIIFCLLTTVAIVKYHLLDVYLVIRKGTGYLLMSTIVAIPYVGIILLFYQLFHALIPVWIHVAVIIVLALDLSSNEARLGDQVVRLTSTERKLLYILMKNAERTVSRRALLREVWGEDQTNSEPLRTYIRRLRDKLSDKPPRIILTERGGGYRLSAPR